MRSPRCQGPPVSRRAGPIRHLARFVLLRPAKCDACRCPFWAFSLKPLGRVRGF